MPLYLILSLSISLVLIDNLPFRICLLCSSCIFRPGLLLPVATQMRAEIIHRCRPPFPVVWKIAVFCLLLVAGYILPSNMLKVKRKAAIFQLQLDIMGLTILLCGTTLLSLAPHLPLPSFSNLSTLYIIVIISAYGRLQVRATLDSLGL